MAVSTGSELRQLSPQSSSRTFHHPQGNPTPPPAPGHCDSTFGLYRFVSSGSFLQEETSTTGPAEAGSLHVRRRFRGVSALQAASVSPIFMAEEGGLVWADASARPFSGGGLRLWARLDCRDCRRRHARAGFCVHRGFGSPGGGYQGVDSLDCLLWRNPPPHRTCQLPPSPRTAGSPGVTFHETLGIALLGRL